MAQIENENENGNENEDTGIRMKGVIIRIREQKWENLFHRTSFHFISAHFVRSLFLSHLN